MSHTFFFWNLTFPLTTAALFHLYIIICKKRWRSKRENWKVAWKS